MPLLRLLTCVICSLTWLQGISQSLTDTITYTASQVDFPNPERGFMQFTETSSGNYVPLDPVDLASWRTLHQPWGADYAFHATLGYRGFYLEDFVNGSISTAYLNAMQTDFNLARQAGVKLVVRFAYTHSDVPPFGDAPKHIVLQHIEQLKPVLQANADVIAVLNMGFIGAWGEGYYTDHFGLGALSQQNWIDRIEVLQALLYALPPDRSVTVRVPQTKQKAVYGAGAPPTVAPLTAQEAWKNTFKARIGFANDCFLSDATDSGTYINYDVNAPAGCDTCVFKPYWAEDSQFVPVGGETCIDWNPYSDCVGQPGGYAQHELARMHFSYLNAGWNNAVNNDWVSGGCSNEIIQRLGYRFELIQGEYTKEAQAGQPVSIKIQLKNVGFAAPFNPRKVRLLLRNLATQAIWVVDLNDNPRSWLPGPDSHLLVHQFCLPMDIPAGEYETLLHLADPYPSISNRPEYAIRLANEGVWEASTGYNRLLHTLIISGSANPPQCNGESCFLPVNPGIPSAQFSAGSTNGCAPFSVQLYNQSASCWQYEWSLPGALPNQSTEPNPVVTYPIAGTFPVSLTVTNPAGSTTEIQQDFISVMALPSPEFLLSNADGFTLYFSNLSQGANNYLWDFGDNSTVSAEINPVHIFPGPGTYTVRLTATNGCGQVSIEKEITVNCPFLDLQIQSSSGSTVCVGQSIQLIASGGSFETYYWGFEDVGLPGENGPVLQLNAVSLGDHGVFRVEGVDQSGCIYQAEFQLTVIALPSAQIQPAGPVQIPYGESLLLQGNTNAETWIWNTGATTSGIEVSDCGIYALTVTNMEGCSQEAVPVSVWVVPVITYHNDTLTSSPANQYQWYLNGQPIPGAVEQHYAPEISGIYHVEVPCDTLGFVSSVSMEIIIASLNDPFTGLIRLYPNPASSATREIILEAQAFSSSPVQVSIVDMSGKNVVELMTPFAAKMRIDTGHLPAGLYIVRIWQDGLLHAIEKWVRI
ncbi:MAG: DUF4832 domain-containing protein [Saprospiraceae bacterium]|nr:DUF4832 domain-containing protein [Saprospiraceae bacterium]